MAKIVISPYANTLRWDKSHLPNPKNYPHWVELVKLMRDGGHEVIQIGSGKATQIIGTNGFLYNLKMSEIEELIRKVDCWVSVDSFLPHLCAYHKLKKGVVLWGQSDPNIFGYSRNTNLLKDRSYLREKQFWIWEQCDYNADAFVSAQDAYRAVLEILAGRRVSP